MNMNDFANCKGTIEGLIEDVNGNTKKIEFKNTILKSGRAALVSALANQIGTEFDYFINKMIFGSNGVTENGSGVPKQVGDERTGLFGSTIVRRPIVANIDPNNNTQVVFTAVVPFNEANGYVLNEMALQLNNSELYSMATFPGISKTSQIQITWNWRISMI
jgi:hypothetical protein